MGAVSFSLDIKLLEFLQKHIAFDVFVETGTFEGNTVAIAKNFFKEIYSVELSEHYYNLVCERFKHDEKIKLFLGNSAEVLAKQIKAFKKRSVIYWLDAHWCEANKTEGQKSQCPLLEELKAIKKLNDQSIIVIDDARLFIATPPQPHEVKDWPHFSLILQQLMCLSSYHYLSILNDTLIFYPKHLVNEFRIYEHHHGVDWLKIYNQAEILQTAADERLALVNKLTAIADERLELIQQLEKVAEERLALINKFNIKSQLKSTFEKLTNKKHSIDEEINK